MKKKKTKKIRGPGSSRSSYVSLAELGEELRRKNPEMLKKVEALHDSETSFSRIVEDIYDWLPYPWQDLEWFEEGVELSLEGRYREAIKKFEEVLQKNPDAYPAWHLMGFVYGCHGKFKREMDCYRKAIKLRPDYPQVYASMGMAYWLQGKEKKAFEQFKRLVPLAPDFTPVSDWLDLMIRRLGRFWTGNGKSGENGSQASGRAIAHGCYWMGNAYLEFGLHIPARHAFKKAVRTWPDFAEAQYELGAIHIKRLRNPKRAEKHLEKAEQLFIRQGDLQRASLVHQLFPGREEVQDKARAAEDWLKEGVRLQQFGRYQGAIDAYKMAIAFKPEFVDAFYNLGIAYGSLEDTGLELIHKAVWAFRQVIRIKPDFVHAYIGLGASHVKRGEYEEAIELLKETLKFAPGESQVLYYLGVACRMSGHHREAAGHLKKAARLQPDSVQVQFYLGLTLMDLQECQEAAEVFQEVVRIKPDFADVHLMLGNLYLEKLGDMEKAVFHLRKAEKLFIKLEDQSRLSHIRQLLSRSSV
ncbi:MAG: tetratricopeptide repeat protein [Nitrospinaceae bacterium]